MRQVVELPDLFQFSKHRTVEGHNLNVVAVIIKYLFNYFVSLSEVRLVEELLSFNLS